MSSVSLDYIHMCKKLIDVFNRHSDVIGQSNELELYFMDLQLMVMKFESTREKASIYLFPLLNEKRKTAKELELLFRKFQHGLHLHAHKSGEGHDKPEIDQFPSFGHSSSSEILRQYESIIHKIASMDKRMQIASGLSKDDFHNLEIHITQFVLSLPLLTLLEEREAHMYDGWEKSFAEMNLLITQKIDPEIKKLKKKSPEIFKLYEASRQVVPPKAATRAKGPERSGNKHLSV